MAKTVSPSPFLSLILTTAIAICLILSCTTCGCTSFFSPDTDEGGYQQPPTFEPTVRPTHIPVPSPTIVCEPTVNRTAAASR